MYDQNYDHSILFQGDIIKDIKFNILPNSEIRMCNIENPPSEDYSKQIFMNDFQINHSIYYTNIGMVLSQNCDIDHRKFILLAPVFTIASRYVRQNSHISSLRGHKICYEIHLQPTQNLPESFVDLQVIIPYNKSRINLQDRIAVLSMFGRGLVQQQLRDYFGRLEAPTYIEPSLPQTSGI